MMTGGAKNDLSAHLHTIHDYGFDLIADVISVGRICKLSQAIDDRRFACSPITKRAHHSLRNLLENVPEVARLAKSDEIRRLVEPILGPRCFAVRGILFDKTPDANWKVIWHQDLTIAVKSRIDVDDFGPWSVKDGVDCVQPPASILENMLAVRVHLDDCFEENGPLRVIPGSHRSGRLTADQIVEMRHTSVATTCESPAGDALLMRPLILHASSAATSPSHRRVIHIEYAAADLPGGLDWFTKIFP